MGFWFSLSVLYRLDRKIFLECVRKYDLHGEGGLHRPYNIRATGVFSEEKTPETPEPSIIQKDLFALQESVESFTVYDDNHQTLSTIELTVGGRPFYPEEYPVANIVPRYRKSFSETMYRTSMQVQEADIFIRFVHKPMKNDREYIPTDFSLYFMYHQKAGH